MVGYQGDVTSRVGTRSHLFAEAAAGLVAVGAGLAVGEIVAAWIDTGSSPFFAVGAAVVDHAPTFGREFAIGTFGTADKPALYIGMGVLIALIAAACGIAEHRRPPIGAVVVAVFGVVGVLAAWDRPDSRWTFVLPSLLGAAVAVLVLRLLVSMLPEEQTDPDDDPAPAGRRVDRRFVLTAGGIAAVAVVVGTVGRRMLADTARTVADRTKLILPSPRTPAPPIPPGADLDLPGATPFITANADFYRIDTALQVPNLTTEGWSLRIHGMVDNEIRIGWDELVAMPMTERVVTLTCVSNEVGGDLIDNARWLGVPMATLLDRAGVRPGADMLLSTSADGWTCGTPVSAVTDGRDALLVIGMNGEPLPVEHGYPVRQVVPGLYGYVSATKWVTDWELTTFADAKAYWTTRGWSALGPIKLSSRIDRPTASRIEAGEVIIAGTAWAQHTGIAAVDVRVDDGGWQRAELATEYSIDTWRQWRFAWDATPGEHTVECRAIDKDGNQQVEAYASPIPEGATGLDARRFSVS